MRLFFSIICIASFVLQSSGQERAVEPLILETRLFGGGEIPVSVPLDYSEFRHQKEVSGVKITSGGVELPSQYDIESGTLTVLVSPEVARSSNKIQVVPIIGKSAKEVILKDAVTVLEKDGVLTVANGKFKVVHDPAKMAGLPSSIKLRDGPVWDQYRMGDRLYQKEPKPVVYFLMYDKTPGIEILKRGPYEVAVRVTARYLDVHGTAPASKPSASYLFTYDRSSLVKIHVETKQESPLFWKEQHLLEIGFSNRDFDQWITSHEKAFAPLKHEGQAGKPQAEWGAFALNGGGMMALQSSDRIMLFDGEGTINHYLHGPWRSWASLSSSADLILALIPSKKPSLNSHRELTSLMTGKASYQAWLTTPKIQAFQKAKNLSSENRHAAWLMDHRATLFSSLTARREIVEKILNKDSDMSKGGNAFGIPGLTVLSDSRQSIAIQKTGDGIGIVNVLDAKSGTGFLAPDISLIWTLEFRFPGDEKRLKKRVFDSLSAWKSVKVETAPEGLRLIWEGIKDWPEIAMRVVGTVRLKDGRSEWDLKVENGSKFTLHEVIFPQWELASLAEVSSKKSYLMMPDASGVVVENPVDAGIGTRLTYPSNKAPMQCFAYYSDKAGLYMANHDPQGALKKFDIHSRPERRSITLETKVPVPNNATPGNDWKSPAPAVLEVFSGDWFDASQIYKKWAKAEATWWPREDKKTPKWFREISAWVLTSGTADYVVPRMKKFAAYMEVPTALHWYTWHKHPFDDNYPEYFPAKPGTAEGVKEMQAAGIRVTPYINGLIWDKSRDDFKNTALPAATKYPDGKTYTSVFASKIEFAPMCPTTKLWQDKQSEIIGRLTGSEFGFDGVYLDQIAASAPVQCYDASHGHPLGGGHWWHEKGYWPLLEKVRATATRNRPDVVLTSEANAETYVNHVDGLLTWHFQNDGQIPLFSAVYGGQIQLFGRAYRKDAWKGIAMRAHTAQALVFGEQLGWITPAVVDDPVAGPYLKQLAKLRYELTDYLADGEMLRPPKLIGKIPEVKTIWPWYSGDGKVTLAGVQTGAWRAKDGRSVLLFVNVLDKEVSFEVDYKSELGDKSLLKKAIHLKALGAVSMEIE